MQYFATHLRPGQQTTPSLRASQYKHSTKRKRDEDSDEPPISPSHDATGSSATSNAQSYASLDSQETAQLRVAGLLPEDAFELPPRPFPHAPARTSNDKFTYAKVQREVAGQEFHLYATDATSANPPVGSKSGATALRQTHLNVLSTVMHRCLSEGDYERAGRAWGMILRTQVAGQPIDPRNHGRWGIGAELLLRRYSPDRSSHSQIEQEALRASDNEQYSPDEMDIFSYEGFEAARDYYERLIVQYPNRKAHPHAVDDRTFYPAMFSLWISEIQEKSRRARRRREEEVHRSRSRSVSAVDDLTITSEDTRVHKGVIQDEELAHAMDIAERLDQLIVSPPFDKQVNLLQLRGYVSIWISDLEIGKAMSREEEQDWDIDSDDRGSPGVPTEDNLRKQTNALQELNRAQEFFRRAKRNGGEQQHATLSSLEVKIKGLNKQIARLRE